MPNKQLVPAMPGVEIYNDEPATPEPRLLTPEDFQLTDLLRQLGKTDAAELARPIRLLGNFKPMAMLARLQEYAKQCSGPAAIVCIRKSDMLPDFIWSYDAENGVNRLVNCKANGGWILGIMTMPASGGVCSYPERCAEQSLYLSLLNCFARGYATNPQWIAANDLERVTSLNQYSEWSDKYQDTLIDPISFPDFVCTENGQGVNNAR